MSHFVSSCCAGEACRCSRLATHKVEESILYDDPNPMRHPLTSYVCCECFRRVFGDAAGCEA